MAFIRELLDQSQEEKTREQLQFLMDSARGKLDAFNYELKEMFLNPKATGQIEVLGARSISTYRDLRADVSKGVSDQVTQAVDLFFNEGNDGVRRGFQKLTESALSTILGDESAGEREQSFFTIMPIGISLVRVDVKCWRYNFRSAGVISTVKNAFCYLLSKSIVDWKKLTESELMYFVTHLANAADLEQMKEYITSVREVYELLTAGRRTADAVIADVNARLEHTAALVRRATPHVGVEHDPLSLIHVAAA